MQVTLEASTLDWMNNGSTLWATRLDDLSGNSVVFSEGYTPVISNKLVQVTNATRPTGTLSYTGSGNGVTATVPLYSINNVADTEDCVTGALTRNIGSADFSSLEWVEGEGTWTTTVSGIKADTTNVMSSNGYEITVSGTNVTVTSSASPTGMFYYEKDSASVSTEATQTMSMTSGINTLGQSDMGRGASFDLTYRGIDYTLALDSSHKYGFKHGSTGSILTGASSQAVVAGSDMVVDVTRLVNGDSAKINAITAWSDIAAGYPEYASYVQYNAGEVKGVTPRVWVNSHERNQILQNGNGTNGLTNWLSYHLSLETTTDGIIGTVNNAANSISMSHINANISKGHTVLIRYTALSNVAQKVRVCLYNNSTYSFGYQSAFTDISANTETVFVRRASSVSIDTNYVSVYLEPNNATVGNTIKVTNLQVVDLTQLFGGNQAMIDSIQTWDDLVAIDASYATYCAYNTGEVVLNAGYTHGGSMTASAPLHGVGTARDTENGVDGKRTVKMASVDLGTLTWGISSSGYGGYYRYSATKPADAVQAGGQNVANIVCSEFTAGRTTDQNGSAIQAERINIIYDYIFIVTDKYKGLATGQFKNAMNGVMLYYETSEPVTTDITPSSISMQQGTNVLTQTDGGRTADFTLDYDGTDYAIATDASRKYLKRINGTDDYITGGSPVAVRGKRDKLIDLTYMFGAGYEPATLAAFYKLFPTWRGYDIPHDKGSVLNFKGTGLKSVGFNLLNIGGRTLGEPQNTGWANTTKRGPFDETKYYVGLAANNYYSPAQVASYTISDSSIEVTCRDGGYGVGFPIRCVPGATYRFENYIANGCRLSFYTYDGTFISGDSVRYKTAPSNAYWCVVIYTPTTSNATTTFTNPCVHLQWSGTRNGDYEPYWDYTRPLPTLTYFPNGMNGLNSVSDEVTSRQAVQRFNMAFLEDIDWTVSDGTWTYQFADMKPDTANIAATHSQSFTLSGNTVTFTSQPTGYLVYELATPVVTVFQDEQNLSYQVSDYGTESILPVNTTTLTTAPLRAMIQYLEDAARTMTHLPENYQSQKSMDAFCQAMGDYFGCTITATYNENTRSYSYSFTANN